MESASTRKHRGRKRTCKESSRFNWDLDRFLKLLKQQSCLGVFYGNPFETFRTLAADEENLLDDPAFDWHKYIGSMSEMLRKKATEHLVDKEQHEFLVRLTTETLNLPHDPKGGMVTLPWVLYLTSDCPHHNNLREVLNLFFGSHLDSKELGLKTRRRLFELYFLLYMFPRGISPLNDIVRNRATEITGRSRRKRANTKQECFEPSALSEDEEGQPKWFPQKPTWKDETGDSIRDYFRDLAKKEPPRHEFFSLAHAPHEAWENLIKNVQSLENIHLHPFLRELHKEFRGEIRNAPDMSYREDVIKRILQYIDKPAGRQVFSVVGGPGAGKTTIARTLLKRLLRKGTQIPHFFIAFGKKDRDLPPTILADIAVQSSPSLAHRPGFYIPAREGEAISIIERELGSLGRSKPLFILLDGLDEADPQPVGYSSLCKLLKQIALPPNVCLILFSRPNSDLQDLVGSYDIELENGPCQEQAIKRFYYDRLHQRIGREESRKIEMEELIDRTEGSFLYAEFAVKDIIDCSKKGIVYNVKEAPRGIDEQLDKERDRLIKGPLDKGPTSCIVATILAHRGTPTLLEWLTFAHVEPFELQNFLEDHEHLFRFEAELTPPFDFSVRVHGFRNAYIRQYLQTKIAPADTLRRAHKRIVKVYQDECPGGDWTKHEPDNYFFGSLAYHLAGAGMHANLVALLTSSPEWMHRQRKVCGSDAPFRDDVMKAMAAIPEEDSPANLMALTKLWTARLVTDHFEQIPDAVLCVMARLGKVDEVLTTVRARRDSLSKLESYTEIYSMLRENPPRELLDAVADLDTRLGLCTESDVDIDLLISTGEILGHCGLKDRSERLLSRADRDTDNQNEPSYEVNHLAHLATTHYRMHDYKRGHTMLAKAVARLDKPGLRSSDSLGALRDLLEPALTYDDPAREHLLGKVRDLIEVISSKPHRFYEYFPLVETIVRYDSEVARQLLEALYTASELHPLLFPEPFLSEFLRHYLMLPSPDIPRIERILAMVDSVPYSDVVDAHSRVSIWLSRSGQSTAARKHAGEAAAHYDEYDDSYWSRMPAVLKCASLTWLSAAFLSLGEAEVGKEYLESARSEIAAIRFLLSRGILAHCAWILIDSNLIDQANRIIDDVATIFYDTPNEPELDDCRVAVVDLLTGVGRLNEPFMLRGWSTAATVKKVCTLSRLYKALASSDAEQAEIMYRECVRAAAARLKRLPSDFSLCTGVFSSLVDAGFETDALLKLAEGPWSHFYTTEIHRSKAAQAIEEEEPRKALEHLSAIVEAYEKKIRNPSFLDSSSSKAVLGAEDNDLLMESTVLLKRLYQDCDVTALLERIRIIMRHTWRHRCVRVHELWNFQELEVEEFDCAISLADQLESDREQAQAYVYLGERAAREISPQKADQIWDKARQIALKCGEREMAETMLILTDSMRNIAAPARVVRLLHEVHDAMSRGHFGGNWAVQLPEAAPGAQDDFEAALECRMRLILQYAQLEQKEDVRRAFREIEADVPFAYHLRPGWPKELLVRTAGAIAQCGLYGLALQILLRTYPDFALSTCVSVVLPALEAIQTGLSVVALKEIAAICAWIRPEWNNVLAVLRPPSATSLVE